MTECDMKGVNEKRRNQRVKGKVQVGKERRG